MTSTPSGHSPATPIPSTPSSQTPSRPQTPTVSLPGSSVEKTPDDSSKLKTFLSILKRFIGVSDIAAVRFSLPAQLLEPVPNLEYWNYLDRPETFVAIGDSNDPLGRMLGCLRFWFTKDLKYVKGKPCKPYNSTLGEFFRCNWVVEDTQPPITTSTKEDEFQDAQEQKQIKISYITEQTSHHPPVSAFWIECPDKGISAYGFDQLSAKFTGTSIKVIPGAYNLGIFVKLHKYGDEEYQMTHPAASLGGLIKGSLSITVADTCFVTCPKTRIKVILQYMEESWYGKNQNRVEGIIFRYDPKNDNITRTKDVKDKDILGRVEGCWHDKIYYTLGSAPFSKSSEQILLIDLTPLWPVPKIIPPFEVQLPNESKKFWSSVTEAIISKQYNQATTLKQELEQRQRDKAEERKSRNAEWKPRFFNEVTSKDGRPTLTEDGKRALEGLLKDQYELKPSAETGA